MKGFTFQLGHKDVFVKTNYKNKTKALASKILRKLALPENPGTVREILYYLQKADCEERQLSNGRKYWDISGENFGGRGSFVDDGNTLIVEV